VLVVVASSCDTEFFSLFQIMSCGTMDLAPLLCVGRVMELSLLLLIRGLLLAVPAISVVYVIGCVDLSIVLLLLRGHLALGFKEPSPSLRGLNAYVNDCKQIGHCLGLLHCDLLNSLDVTHPIMKDIDDFDVLDVRDNIPGIAETFHVISEASIMLLLDGLQGFSYRWTLVHTLKVSDEHGT
jgi:hypothetical protein